MSSFQSLEARFIQAMEQIAALSLDKEQLEHLVDRPRTRQVSGPAW